MREDTELLKRAADRLEWLSEEPPDDAEGEVARPTPPPSVGFIHLKGC